MDARRIIRWAVGVWMAVAATVLLAVAAHGGGSDTLQSATLGAGECEFVRNGGSGSGGQGGILCEAATVNGGRQLLTPASDCGSASIVKFPCTGGTVCATGATCGVSITGSATTITGNYVAQVTCSGAVTGCPTPGAGGVVALSVPTVVPTPTPPLGIAQGGTGRTSLTANAIQYGSDPMGQAGCTITGGGTDGIQCKTLISVIDTAGLTPGVGSFFRAQSQGGSGVWPEYSLRAFSQIPGARFSGWSLGALAWRPGTSGPDYRTASIECFAAEDQDPSYGTWCQWTTSPVGSHTEVARLKLQSGGSVQFVPLAAAPTTPTPADGDCYFSSSTHRLNCYDSGGSAWIQYGAPTPTPVPTPGPIVASWNLGGSHVDGTHCVPPVEATINGLRKWTITCDTSTSGVIEDEVWLPNGYDGGTAVLALTGVDTATEADASVTWSVACSCTASGQVPQPVGTPQALVAAWPTGTPTPGTEIHAPSTPITCGGSCVPTPGRGVTLHWAATYSTSSGATMSAIRWTAARARAGATNLGN